MENGLISRERVDRIFEAVEGHARRAGIREVEVGVSASSEALTRFANNAIHQNVAERTGSVSIRLAENGRTARVTTNRLDADGIRAAVDQVVAVTRASEPDPELQPMYADSVRLNGDRWDGATARHTPEERARAAAEAIRIVREQGQTAAGILASGDSVDALANSAGLRRYYAETMAQFSITAMASDSSGWAKASSWKMADVEPERLARAAARKASLSADPVEIPPGKYTVVLEPAAVLDLAGQIFGDFSQTAIEDQRSFLSERIGQQLFGKNIAIWDEVACPLQTGPPFDGEGVPRQRLHLVDNGVVRDVARSRARAAKSGETPTGHGFPLPNEHGEAPVNIVMAGGKQTIEDLIASTERGVLVTRLWYIREVEPYEKVMTGMTRDGTFLIEDGEIRRGVRNLRFNQSVVELLSNIEAMSESVRASGEEAFDMVVPGMKAHGFRFSEVTRY